MQLLLILSLAVELLHPPIATSQPAGILSRNVFNDSTSPMIEVRIKPASDSAWGPNLLQEPIPPASEGSVSIPSAEGVCAYDVRFVLGDKHATTSELWSVDFCKESDVLWNWTTTGDD